MAGALGMRARGSVLAAGTAMALGCVGAALPGSEAKAAVRLCQPLIRGTPAEAADETEARRAALASWTALARAYGEGYASWRIAGNRMLSCRPAAEGRFRCQASANPCIVQQVPPRGAQPLPPSSGPRPKGPGTGEIDI